MSSSASKNTLLPFSLFETEGHSGPKPNMHASLGIKLVVHKMWMYSEAALTEPISRPTAQRLKHRYIPDYKCNVIVNTSHVKDNPERDQTALRVKYDDLATNSVFWLERADVLCICSPHPTISATICLSHSQTFSYGLTLLHNQQQDHAQHITFRGQEREWANHSSHSLCTVSCAVMEQEKNVYGKRLWYEGLRQSRKEGECEQPVKNLKGRFTRVIEDRVINNYGIFQCVFILWSVSYQTKTYTFSYI